MNFNFEVENFKRKLKLFISKNKLGSAILKGVFSRIIISLLFFLKIVIFRIK